MSNVKCKIRIGTSGWHYDHWIKRFYPEDLSRSQWLTFFAESFDTVEINNTFYRLPKETAVKNWFCRSPENFQFAVKASRYITHIKRLKEPSETLVNFFESLDCLKQKLGPVLYQLPPNFRKNIPRLEDFLKALGSDRVSVFEFRDKSWFDDDTFDLLKRYNIAFCIHDHPAAPTPKVITSDTVYIRLHSPLAGNTGNYSNAELKNWADWIKHHQKNTANIYIYFNNDINANAVKNAKMLKIKIYTLEG